MSLQLCHLRLQHQKFQVLPQTTNVWFRIDTNWFAPLTETAMKSDFQLEWLKASTWRRVWSCCCSVACAAMQAAGSFAVTTRRQSSAAIRSRFCCLYTCDSVQN